MRRVLPLLFWLFLPPLYAQLSHLAGQKLFSRTMPYEELRKEFARMEKKQQLPVYFKELMLRKAYEQGDTAYFKELLTHMVARHHFVLYPAYINEPYFQLLFKGNLKDWYRSMWKKEIVKWYTHNGDILEWRMLILDYHKRYNMVQRIPGREMQPGDSSIRFMYERRDALLREAAFRIVTIAAANDSVLPSDDNMGLGISDAVDDILFDFVFSDSSGTYFDMVEELYWKSFRNDLTGSGFPFAYDSWMFRSSGGQYYGTVQKFGPVLRAEGLMERRKRWKLD